MINERSFIGQAETVYDVPILMRTMRNVVRELRPIRGSDPIHTHSSFFDCQLSPNYTVYEWARTIFMNADDRDIRQFFIRTLKNGPFIDKALDKALEYHECHFKKQDVPSSSIAGAAYFKGVLVSLQNTPEFESEYLPVKFSTDGEHYEELEVPNLTKEGQSWIIRRRYVPSPKHDRGGRGARMDLDDETAQIVLDKSVSYGRQFYSYHNDKFYTFQPDNAGGYHGYFVGRVPMVAIGKMREAGVFPKKSQKIKNIIGRTPFRPE